MFGEVDPGDITGTWRPLAVRLEPVVSGAQLAAANGADEYVAAALAAQGIDAPVEGRVVPRRLAGQASDGRNLSSLLDQPRRLTLASIASGHAAERALASGWVELEMILRTQVADAGRVADGLSVVTRPRVGYVRMINPGACGRCAILAGRFYRYNRGFLRHPNCMCVHIPSQESESQDARLDPREYFDSLPRSEQNRLFGAANARAIRDGADPARVINATSRRGAVYTTADGRKATREGTRRGTERGTVRLVPEEIYRIAPNRAEAINLLRLHGYIT